MKRREELSPAQKVASLEEAEQLISKGWTFVGVLPNGKVVLQRGIRDRSVTGPEGFEPSVSGTSLQLRRLVP